MKTDCMLRKYFATSSVKSDLDQAVCIDNSNSNKCRNCEEDVPGKEMSEGDSEFLSAASCSSMGGSDRQEERTLNLPSIVSSNDMKCQLNPELQC